MVQKTLFFALFLALAPVPLWPQTTESAAKPAAPSVYVVKKGDCLWKISQQVWGNAYNWPFLFAANEGKIQNPNLIYPGQKFTIPTTLTRAELAKANQLIAERSGALPVRTTNSEGMPLSTRKKHVTTSKEKPSSSVPEGASSASAAAKPVNAGNVPAATQNQPPSENPSSEGSSKLGLLVVTLLVLGGGIFLWMRRRKGSFATLQQPKPLSSFPQSAEPPAGRPTPSPVSTTPEPPKAAAPTSMGAPVAPIAPPPTPSAAIPSPSSPTANPPATPGLPPLNAPEAKPPVYTGTITSISTSQPPVPSKAEPGNQPGTTTASPSVPSSSSPSMPPGSPSASPSATPQPPDDKPSDNSSNPPPAVP